MIKRQILRVWTFLSGWFSFDDHRAHIVGVDSDKTFHYVLYSEVVFLSVVLEREESRGKAGLCRDGTGEPFGG